MSKKGIDVSVWQGTINWHKVKQSGIDFAMLRGGYGKTSTQKDKKFEQNYKNAKAVGMPIGAYHYSYAKSVEDAKKEAEFCISYLKGKKFEYPIAFDIEDKSQAGLGKATLTAITKTFCQALQKAGYYVAIYASLDWLNNKLDMNALKGFDIWVAQWATKCTYKGNYGMWQYADNGIVSGISGNVDMDIAYIDYPKTIKTKGLNGYKTTTKPTTKPKQKEKYKGTLPSIKPNTSLKRGSKGEAVKQLQRFLNWYGGYGLAIDGHFGALTEQAVKKYQKAEGLQVDGHFGVKSLARAKEVKR